MIDTTRGKTNPVFGYADAIPERVFSESPYDSDKNNVKDVELGQGFLVGRTAAAGTGRFRRQVHALDQGL